MPQRAGAWRLKILIIKTSALGDIMQCLFVIDYLKTKFPSASVDWMVEERFSDLCLSCPGIDEVIVVNTKKIVKGGFGFVAQTIHRLKKLRYDLVIDLQGNIKSGLLMAPVRAKEKVGFSLTTAPEWIGALFAKHRYRVDPKGPIQFQYLSLLEQHFKDNTAYRMPKIELKLSAKDHQRLEALSGAFMIPYNTIMVCFGSNWENKKLSKGQIVALLKSIEGPCFLFIYSGEKEKVFAEELSKVFKGSLVLGDLSIPLWQYMMLKTKGVICMDSAALHLAALSKVKSFAFFGPSSSLVYNPREKMHHAYQGRCPYEVKFSKRCGQLRTCKTGACLKSLDLEAAAAQLKKWL